MLPGSRASRLVEETSHHTCDDDVRRGCLPAWSLWRVGETLEQMAGQREAGQSPWGQSDRATQRIPFPFEEGLPSLERHVNRTDGWLKLSLPCSPGELQRSLGDTLLVVHGLRLHTP